MAILEVKDACKSYGDHQVLDHVSFSIEPGKIVGLLGQTGEGKTTLIKLINDLLTLDEGQILVNGFKPGKESKLAISYLPERMYLDRRMRVSQVVDYFEDFYANFSREKAESLLRDLHLDLNEKLSKMSKGMLEKLQLALVMSRDADLYILDEPLGGVDPAARDYILDTILSNFSEGSSVLISTHLISDIERILDEVLFLKDGKIVLHTQPDELREKSGESVDEMFRRMFYVR